MSHRPLPTRTTERDGIPQQQATCPNCYAWADVDDDQLEGAVSLICPECRWHGYIDGRTV